MMTKERLIEMLQELAIDDYDPECNHSKADSLLLEYINDEEVTEAFDAIDKWYA